jgi:hypothetical protein
MINLNECFLDEMNLLVSSSEIANADGSLRNEKNTLSRWFFMGRLID